jgi:uncharacterized protein (UPF0335 family)
MTEQIGGNARATLKALADRIDRLEDEKQEISDAIREILIEAKSQGFDAAQLRAAVKIRRQREKDRDKHDAAAAIRDMYLHVLGVIADLDNVDACSDAVAAEAEWVPPSTAESGDEQMPAIPAALQP